MNSKKYHFIAAAASSLLFSCSTFRPTDYQKNDMALANSLLGKNIAAIRTVIVCPTESTIQDNCKPVRNSNFYFESWVLYHETGNLYIKIKTGDGTIGYINIEAANNIKYDSVYSPTPVDSLEISDGCVGNKIDYCLFQFNKFMYHHERDEEIKNQIEKNALPDINGKQKPGDMKINLMGGTVGFSDSDASQFITIFYDRNNIVTSMSIDTKIVPNLIRTFDDYSKSGMAELIWAMVGQKCPDTNPNKLYPFFENNVKNKAFSEYDGSEKTMPKSQNLEKFNYGASFCGKKLASLTSAGEDYSMATWRNPYGYWGLEKIQVTQ